jgi:hypothetical protein
MVQMSATVMSKADTFANADTAMLRTTEFRARQFMWRSLLCTGSAGRQRARTAALRLHAWLIGATTTRHPTLRVGIGKPVMRTNAHSLPSGAREDVSLDPTMRG